MKGMPENYKEFNASNSFREAKSNFYRAARTGLNTVFSWNEKPIMAADLILNELIPIAEKGLQSVNVNSTDITNYLGIVHDRVLKNKTGAEWQIKNFSGLERKNE